MAHGSRAKLLASSWSACALAAALAAAGCGYCTKGAIPATYEPGDPNRDAHWASRPNSYTFLLLTPFLGTSPICDDGYTASLSPPKRRGATGSAESMQTKLAAAENDSGLKSRFIAVQARKGASDADSVTLLPVTLSPGFRVDVTCGVFSDRLGAGVAGGMFGLEIHGEDAATEIYAVYAERSANPEGLTLRAVSHDGVEGASAFLPGADRVDLSAFSTGPTITLSYRVTGGPSPFYTQLAAIDVVSQGPYRPATAIYDVDSKGQVGFTNLDIPIAGIAAKAKDAPPLDAARDKIVRAVLGCMSGLAKLNGAPPSLVVAQSAEFDFVGAMNSLQGALADLQTFEGPSAEKARKALDKAWRLAGVTGRALGVDPPEIEIPRVLKGFSAKFMPLVETALSNIGRL